ncbi:MAG TPA: hypothetical protein VM577_05305 [Anaerovoracaceae bacterium]|nr:hypothetical protein [Anaerovoracaceae bacterium]
MNVKKILQLANEFYKEAGVFEGPPLMTEVITKWALGSFAAQVWAIAKKRLEQASKEKGWAVQTMIVESNLLIQECKRFAVKPATRLTKYSTINFPLDYISEWKYLTPLQQKNGPKFLSEKKDWPTGIKVTFYFSLTSKPKNITDDDWDALWLPDKKEIYLSGVTNITNVKQFNNSIQRIQDLVRHEVQHLGQWALKDIKNLSVDVGVPGQKIRSKMVDVHGVPLFPSAGDQEKRIEHTRRDVEFYTNLKDSINNFSRAVVNEKDPMAFAKYWVGEDPSYQSNTTPQPDYFFTSLKNTEPAKWRKAVFELFKIVS